MKAYVLVTGGVFGLLLAVHVVRVFFDGLQVLRDPFYLISTGLAGGLCLWAVGLLAGPARRLNQTAR